MEMMKDPRKTAEESEDSKKSDPKEDRKRSQEGKTFEGKGTEKQG